MRRAMVRAGGIIVAATLSACGGPSPQHTEGGMLSGTHTMPGSKSAVMTNEYMPERAPNCSEAALATMPPEHRQACLNALGARR